MDSTSYGKDFPYKVYKVFNTKKESLYLIEVDRSYHKEYDFLFVKGENYVFTKSTTHLFQLCMF